MAASDPGRPAWMDQGISKTGGFILAVGHGRPAASEQEARNDALAAATSEFVRYTGVEVEAFDRAVETYAVKGDQQLKPTRRGATFHAPRARLRAQRVAGQVVRAHQGRTAHRVCFAQSP